MSPEEPPEAVLAIGRMVPPLAVWCHLWPVFCIAEGVTSNNFSTNDLSTKEKALCWLTAGFFITLLVPRAPVINNLFTGALFLFSWFYSGNPGGPGSGWANRVADKWRVLGQRKEVVFMLLFYLLHIVSALLSHNRQEAFRMLELRLPLLVFPLSFGLLNVQKAITQGNAARFSDRSNDGPSDNEPPARSGIRTAVKDRIIQAYGAAVSLGALVCTIYAGIRYGRTGDGVYLYNDSLTEVLDIQSSYYALMVLLAVAGFIYLLGKGYFSGRRGIYVRGGIVLLLIFHFMLASRISITILYTGLLIVLGAYIRRTGFEKNVPRPPEESNVCPSDNEPPVRSVVRHRKRALALWLVLGLVAALGLCMKLLPKTMNRFRELEYPSYSFTRVAPESHYNGTLTPDQWNGANIRLAIWKCGWEVAQKHWLTGVQLGDKQDSLMGKYKENGFTFALERNRNMHNNYLDTFCAFGAVGIVLFLLGYLVIPLWKAVRARDMLGLALLLAMGVSMAVESYFDRSLGCLVIGFFFSFIAATREPRAVT